MTALDVRHRRLLSHRLTGRPFHRPEEIVHWLGAVQAQDYAAAKWGLALRSHGLTDTDIDRALAEGAILRTHVMRPTWHFVTPADIRWLLALTAPRVHALNATYYRKFGLDDALFGRSQAVLASALQGGRHLTRQELKVALHQAGIATDPADQNLRLAYVMMRAELDGLICSGPRRGRQFTYALLDERAPQATTLDRDQALAELARRYFTSHGPATLKDYVWWSGLTTADARAGLDLLGRDLVSETIDGRTCWFSPSTPPAREEPAAAFLLPVYDEYTNGYSDYSPIFDPAQAAALDPLFAHAIVLHGRVVGWWRRTLNKRAVLVETRPFSPLTEAASQAVAAAAHRFGAFLELPVQLA